MFPNANNNSEASSLTYKQSPTEMRLFKSHECAIYCEAGYGPTFGAGHDLHISGM